jgi:hypothetical protein
MANDERNTQGANQGGGMRGSGGDERVGRGVREGMDAGQSRNAHTSGSPGAREESDRGAGGYGASSGFDEGTRAAEDETLIEHMERGATPSRTRTGDVGRQAESGLETDPEEGVHGYDAADRDREGGREEGNR